MLDGGDPAIIDVRIHHELRWRWNGSRYRNTRHRGDVGNVELVRNISDIGNVDHIRNAGNFGPVGNVRVRLKQYCFVFNADIDVAYNVGRRCSNGNSDGIDRDWQSWCQLRSSRTNNDRIAHCGYHPAGTNHADGYISICCFVFHDDKPIPVPIWQRRWNVEHHGRLLKQPFNRELDQP